ncbi:MAG: PAS domain S-box protein [Desulfarculus sp.]|nr:PAS domain S-box protein [Desulfarculus sp.]
MELPPGLSASPHLLSQVLGTLTHAVILADLGGTVLYLNPQAERLLGCQATEAQGQALSRFFMSDDQDFLYPNLLHLASQGQAFRGELLLRNGQGQGFFAFLSLDQVPPEPGRAPLILLGLEDIDHQKKLERILGKANYGDLLTIANSIAHELRNPLTGIGGFVNRLYKSCRISMDHDQYYKYIINNLNRIELLVRKVNDLVALHDPSLAEESLGEVVEETLRARGDQIAQCQITVRTQMQELRLALDRQQIQRGLGILIDNALEFTPQGGAINIEARQEDNCCRLTFSDSGRGIAPQDLPFIFNPFFSTKADGLGIDLAVLKRIVQAHGGSVRVQSQPGQGATFLLELPLERRRAIRTTLLAGQNAGV